jgi:hypothetical protein
MEATVKIHERPDMENPVYKVSIEDKEFFMQRQEGMNPGDTAWYQVEWNDDYWQNVGDGMFAGLLGYTKAEAVDYLEKHLEEL